MNIVKRKKKLTLYQASKYTGISRYKLEQAIQNGVLECIEGEKNVKCFILEDKLNEFLDEYGDDYRRFDYENERKKLSVSDEIGQYISREVHDQIVKEKNRVIELLEYQNTHLGPNSANQNPNMDVQKIISAINELPDSSSDIKGQLVSKLQSISNNE